jgi:hypothetical protein
MSLVRPAQQHDQPNFVTAIPPLAIGTGAGEEGCSWKWLSVPAASSAFCGNVSTQLLSVRIIATHVFGISHVCDLSKRLDSELRWCRGVVVVRS